MIDTTPIMQIIKGEVEDTITMLQTKIASATNFMLMDTTYADITVFKKDIADLMAMLMYLKETDSTLLGLWKKRTTQISGYLTALNFVDTKNKNNDDILLNKIKKHIPTLIANVPNISAFGDILFYIDVVKNRIKKVDDTEDIVSEIIVKKVNPKYYVREKDDDGFDFIENTDWTNKYDLDKSKYIYLRDELFFIGGVMRGIAVYSLAKQSNYNSWFNGNNRLFSALIASYDTNKLLIDFTHKNKTGTVNEDLQKAIRTVFDSLETLNKFGRAVIPDAIKFEQQRLVDSNIGDSYLKFISSIETMFEIAILGQSGTTRNDNTGSFAKAKTMNLTTEDIKWTDINYAEALVNMYIEKVLPLLNNTIKPENISFSFVLDENQDTSNYADLLQTISSMQIKTLDTGRGFALPVQEVFKGLGMQANTDYYNDDEMFVLGDNDGSFMANEIENIENEVDENEI